MHHHPDQVKTNASLGNEIALEKRKEKSDEKEGSEKKRETLASTDSCVVPHRSTNDSALWLTAQIGRDAVLSESYGQR